MQQDPTDVSVARRNMLCFSQDVIVPEVYAMPAPTIITRRAYLPKTLGLLASTGI
jgi:hypothetical protein